MTFSRVAQAVEDKCFEQIAGNGILFRQLLLYGFGFLSSTLTV